MRTNELIQLFKPIVIQGLIDAGLTDVNVWQFNQPTQQGISTAPLVTFQQIGDYRRASIKQTDTFDSINNEMIHIEEQVYESTFQFNALVTQVPGVIGITSVDLINQVVAILQSSATITELIKSNVEVYRAADIRINWFSNDRGQYEVSASVDIVFIHSMITDTIIDYTTNVVSGIHPI